MAAASTSSNHPSELLASLEKHNASLTKLLSLIPSRFYAAPDPEEADSRWMKKKKRKTGEEIKEQKKKAKQDKFDPAKQTTAADLVNQAGPSSQSLPPPSPALPAPVRPLPPTATISDLRARLHSKIEGFRKDRGVDDADPESRTALEADARRRRGEMRDKRRRERKEERRKTREKEAVTGKSAKPQLVVPALPRENDSVSYPTVKLPSASSHKNNFKPIANPSHALAHLEKHKRKIESLSEDKRKEVQERERWAKAQERASGGKVADVESTLKKAVKRKEKEKSKSGKEWSERKKDLDKAQYAANKKRTDNIAARADARRNKKFGIKDKNKPKKKGRPGFEGGRNKKKLVHSSKDKAKTA